MNVIASYTTVKGFGPIAIARTICDGVQLGVMVPIEPGDSNEEVRKIAVDKLKESVAARLAQEEKQE